ncbi:MAG: hypothetical protein AAF485_03240 [Chloroflexota bacterium]
MGRQYMRPSSRETGDDPVRRLLAAILVRTYRDLYSDSPQFRQRAIEFFDEEGIAWAAAFGIPTRKVRQKLGEAMSD